MGNALEWLKANVDHQGDDCLIWPFYRDWTGRGRVSVGLKSAQAHREMLFLATGIRPKGMEAAHSCGRGADGCVNPRHLSWKTRAENEADKILHGTTNRGERNGRCKLSEDDVGRVRLLKAGGMAQERIAETMGVSRGLVSMILRGYRRNVSQEAPSR
jgi:hypothetical protein